MGPQAFGPETEVTKPESVWNSTEAHLVEDLKREFGEQHPGQERYIGFSVALIPTLNLKPDQLRSQINLALDNAERISIPIFFHLDDQHFWWRNPELSQNPEMVEWSDFPRAGTSKGPVAPRYWLNWGDPAGVYPTPPPCFACPAFKAALAKRLKECVAEPIVQRLNVWRKEGKEYLFAGVAAGNETKVPDFSRGYEGYAGKPGEAGGLDRTQFPAVKVRMSKEEMVPIGYHSLFAMGYDQQSIQRLAQTRGKSVNKVVEELFYDVAHNYAEFQAKTLNQAGVPKERIYTHFTSSARSVRGSEDHPQSSQSSGRGGSNNLTPPVQSSVNNYSRPGFTVVRNGVDLNEFALQLSKAHAPEGGKAWAAVETYACTGQPGVPQTKEQYEEYLGGLLAYGAKVVNVYGWNIPGGPYAVKNSGVVPAVKKWLADGRLPKTWFRTPQLVSLPAKMAKLQATAREAVSHGRDPHAIQAIIQSFQSELEPLVKAGKLEEAEATVDRAIARVQALPAM